MKRPRTTSFASPSVPSPSAAGPEQSPTSAWRESIPIVAALLAVLDAAETAPKAGPVLKAYRSAMRRQGEAVAALGGATAMEAVLDQIADADPARAEARTVAVREAWAGLPSSVV